VRAAPNQEMVVDRWVSQWGGTVATVENAPRRVAVARSPAWTRGSSLGRARMRARGEEKRVWHDVGSFEAEAGEAGAR
jgi:hypothetical protein